MSSHDAYISPSEPQVIEGQYLDQQRLMSLLKQVYGTSKEGKNNFRVEVIPFPVPPTLIKLTVSPPAPPQPIQDLPIKQSRLPHRGN